MKVIFILAAFFMSFAWLVPIHLRPWVTYTGELYSFISLLILSVLFLINKVKIPKIGIPLLLLACIPFIQLMLGQVFFFSTAMMSAIFVSGFWLASVLGYNFSTENYCREKTFTYLSYIFLVSGVVTGFIAICQWLNLDAILPGMVNIEGNQRPFANFAQPNNMATFLVMALMSCLYLYEKKKMQTSLLVACALCIVIGVVLSQSRTSWVATIAIVLYLAFYQYKGIIHLKWYYSTAWLIFFISSIVAFPLLSQLVTQVIDAEVVQSRDVVSRATGDMSRFAIWQQMLAAIQAEPWWGYGWYQTSVAFVEITDTVQGPVWIRSAHNFIIDFLIWNGAVIGVPFLAYFSYLGYQMQRWVKTPESVIGILMIGAFVTHAMFEFPQHYAYFLLPIGFIIGIVQSQNASIQTLKTSIIFNRIIFLLALVVFTIIIRDYTKLVPKLGESYYLEHKPSLITNQTPIYLITEFNHRIDWIRLNPYSKASATQIQEGEQMVLSYPTKYNLIKYAKLLAFNGYETEAKHQLQRLKVIQKTEMSYEELMQDMPR
ncbi:PglL family O-oligosaccharyltransferase [Acinetobacter sp. YH12100]|uniref:PglL family O-oligosaccharyltransferase n=1 Tax=Acinetobacter sp. YH12100 TaxID=2601089 RepID=UPI0015D387AF|nr:O-antigen ligase family protein [Acinetobacter sp. YH12100]